MNSYLSVSQDYGLPLANKKNMLRTKNDKVHNRKIHSIRLKIAIGRVDQLKNDKNCIFSIANRRLQIVVVVVLSFHESVLFA